MTRQVALVIAFLGLLAGLSSLGAQTRDMKPEDFRDNWRWRQFDEDIFGHDVTALAHDHDGDLYAGLANTSMFRYDGYRWTRISLDPAADPSDLDPIRRIIISGKGTDNTRLYAISDRGLWRLEGDLYLVHPGKISLAAASHDGGVFIIDAVGKVLKVDKDGSLRPHDDPGQRKYPSANDFLIDVNRVHWLAANDGLHRREPARGTSGWREDARLPGRVKGTRCLQILSVPYVFAKNPGLLREKSAETPELWALFEISPGERELLRRYPSTEDTWIPVSFDGETPNVASVSRDILGNYYLIDDSGRLYFSRDAQKFEKLELGDLGIAAESVGFGIQDSHGFNWFTYRLSSQRGGVASFNSRSDRWIHIPFDGDSVRNIRALLTVREDHGGETIWAGCEDGLYSSSGGEPFTRIPSQMLKGVSTLARDKWNRIWAGSENGFRGAYYIDAEGHPWVYEGFKLQSSDKTSQNIKRIVQGVGSKLWFMPVETAANPSDTYTVFWFSGNVHLGGAIREEIPLGEHTVTQAFDLAETQTGDLILATDKGLFSKSGKVWTEEDGLKSARISHVLEAPDSSIWLCYFLGLGVARIAPDGRVQHFDESDGLPSNRVWSITSTGGGGDGADAFVWLGTQSGIARFDGSTWYGYPVPGLKGMAGCTLTRSVAQDRTVYLGTFDQGAYRLHLDDRRRPRVYPPGYERIASKWAENVYRFTLHGWDFEEQTPSDELLFRYRLGGGQWSPFSTERTVVLRDVEPGELVFAVEARDLDNKQSQPVLIKFPVPRAFLATPWIFWPAVVLGGLLLLALVYVTWKSIARWRDPLRKASHGFENATASAFVLDLDGRVVSYNPAAIQTLRLEDLTDSLMGLPAHAIAALPGADVRRLVQSVLSGRAERAELEEFEDATGRILRLHVVPVQGRLPRSPVRGAILLVDDCTQSARERATRRRRQRMGAVQDLAGRIHAHIEASLERISSELERLAGASESPTRSEWDSLEKQSELLADLAGSLRHFVGRDGGADRIEMSTVEILEGLMGGSANGTGILPSQVRVDYRAQPGLWNVRIEREAIGKAIEAVLRNAADAMPEGGSVTVRLSNLQLDDPVADLSPGRYVEMSVQDTGPGIDSIQLERIFDPLFTTKARSDHRGLGLSFAYGAVRRHGGDMQVRSESGAGTTVRILLPAHG